MLPGLDATGAAMSEAERSVRENLSRCDLAESPEPDLEAMSDRDGEAAASSRAAEAVKAEL